MFSLFSLAVLVLAPLTWAQTQNPIFIAGLIRAFQTANLTSLGNASLQINSTTAGQNLFAQLSSGNNFTIFAPSNVAFQNVSTNVTSDPNLLANVLAYHVVNGNFVNHTTFFPNDTVGRTLLDNSSFVNLEGNKSQVLAWTNRADNRTHVLNQPADVTVQGATSFQNIQINIIDGVLTIPTNFSTTISNVSNLSDFELIGDIITTPFTNSTTNQTTNVTVLEFLDGANGFTLFAPNNEAFTSPNFTASGLINNQTLIFDVLENMLINGSTVYSPILVNTTSLITAGGQPLMFTTNSTGTFVSSNGTVARIVQPDVLISNGVVHVIDNLLINTQTDDAAASSAFSSASSAATVSTTESGPLESPTRRAIVRRNNAVQTDVSSDASVVLFGLLLGAMFVVF